MATGKQLPWAKPGYTIELSGRQLQQSRQPAPRPEMLMKQLQRIDLELKQGKVPF